MKVEITPPAERTITITLTETEAKKLRNALGEMSYNDWLSKGRCDHQEATTLDGLYCLRAVTSRKKRVEIALDMGSTVSREPLARPQFT